MLTKAILERVPQIPLKLFTLGLQITPSDRLLPVTSLCPYQFVILFIGKYISCLQINVIQKKFFVWVYAVVTFVASLLLNFLTCFKICAKNSSYIYSLFQSWLKRSIMC